MMMYSFDKWPTAAEAHRTLCPNCQGCFGAQSTFSKVQFQRSPGIWQVIKASGVFQDWRPYQVISGCSTITLALRQYMIGRFKRRKASCSVSKAGETSNPSRFGAEKQHPEIYSRVFWMLSGIQQPRRYISLVLPSIRNAVFFGRMTWRKKGFKPIGAFYMYSHSKGCKSLNRAGHYILGILWVEYGHSCWPSGEHFTAYILGIS